MESELILSKYSGKDWGTPAGMPSLRGERRGLRIVASVGVVRVETGSGGVLGNAVSKSRRRHSQGERLKSQGKA